MSLLVEHKCSVCKRKGRATLGRTWVHQCQPQSPKRPCIHRGAQTPNTIDCPTCSGNVRLKLFACARHGQCLPLTTVAGVPCCTACRDYVPQPSAFRFPLSALE